MKCVQIEIHVKQKMHEMKCMRNKNCVKNQDYWSQFIVIHQICFIAFVEMITTMTTTSTYIGDYKSTNIYCTCLAIRTFLNSLFNEFDSFFAKAAKVGQEVLFRYFVQVCIFHFVYNFVLFHFILFYKIYFIYFISFISFHMHILFILFFCFVCILFYLFHFILHVSFHLIYFISFRTQFYFV